MCIRGRGGISNLKKNIKEKLSTFSFICVCIFLNIWTLIDAQISNYFVN